MGYGVRRPPGCCHCSAEVAEPCCAPVGFSSQAAAPVQGCRIPPVFKVKIIIIIIVIIIIIILIMIIMVIMNQQWEIGFSNPFIAEVTANNGEERGVMEVAEPQANQLANVFFFFFC